MYPSRTYRAGAFGLCLALALCACLIATPLSAPTPEPLSQWGVAASSNIETGEPAGTNAQKAVGRNVPNDLCDASSMDVYAWVSKGPDSWLEVFFETPVYPSELIVHESLHANQVTKVEMIDQQGEYIAVESPVTKRQSCPYELKLDLSKIEQEVIGARIWVDDSSFFRAGIDAVSLTGRPTGNLNTFGTPTPPPGTPTAVPAALGERSFSDRPDDFPDMYQIHVVYLLFKDQSDLERDLDGSLAASVRLANEWFAEQTGGSTLRFDTYQGELDVTFKQFNLTKTQFLDNVQVLYDREHELYPSLVIEDYYLYWIGQKAADLDLVAPGKYYIVYVELEHSLACGQSNLSDNIGIFFLQTSRCGYGRLGASARAWETEFVLVHEFLHGIGLVAACGTNEKNHHTTDALKDLMYSSSGSGEVNVLDVGNDDYYDHSIPNCPDLADSVFLEPLPDAAKAPLGWPDAYRLK